MSKARGRVRCFLARGLLHSNDKGQEEEEDLVDVVGGAIVMAKGEEEEGSGRRCALGCLDVTLGNRLPGENLVGERRGLHAYLR